MMQNMSSLIKLYLSIYILLEKIRISEARTTTVQISGFSCSCAEKNNHYAYQWKVCALICRNLRTKAIEF